MLAQGKKTIIESLMDSKGALLMLLILGSATVITISAKYFGLVTTGLALGAPIVLVVLHKVFKRPALGLWITFILNYFVLGITRYIPAPLGLTIDSMLVITFIALFFQKFHSGFPWHKLKSGLVTVSLVWFLFIVMQLFNPEAVSRIAWFYAMRGLALYMILTIVLTLILFNKWSDVQLFINLWGAMAVMAVLWGMRQEFFGVDHWEQHWLNSGGDVTHVLYGRLRIFSFFSDAGQFGGAMGHCGVVFTILAMNTDYKTNLKKFIWYGFVGMISIYGMLISGTRGALAVPLGGFLLYLVLCNRVRIMALTTLLGSGSFVFLKYTSIMYGVYMIRRMRTALDPNNPSLRARIINQIKLKSYLSSRPIGGGVGSAGNWGSRFSPGTFLADTPTDSWFVMIWAETGIIGLFLHLASITYLMVRGAFMATMRSKNKEEFATLTALLSGLFGVVVCSYGNGVLGQMPTGLIFYMSLAFIFQAGTFDNKKDDSEEEESSTSLTVVEENVSGILPKQDSPIYHRDVDHRVKL